MERVYFYDQLELEHDVKGVFNIHKKRIKKVIPDADIHHVGSTAIPNSLTKGDLDIQVRVSAEQFNNAVNELSKLYDINEGSIKTNEFRTFKDDKNTPELDVQVTAFNSEFDILWKFREVFLQNDLYRVEYNQLKEKFEGKSMEGYRKAKNEFFNKIKQSIAYNNLSQGKPEHK